MPEKNNYCLELTYILSTLNRKSLSLKFKLEGEISNFDSEGALALQEEIEKELDEMKRLFSTETMLEFLKDKDRWELLEEAFKNKEFSEAVKTDSVSLYLLIRYLFAVLPIIPEGENAGFDYFYNSVVTDQQIQDFVNSFVPEGYADNEEGKKELETLRKYIRDAIVAAYIAKLLPENGRITIKNQSWVETDYVGIGFNSGILSLNSTGHFFGYGMDGGILRAGRTGNMAGFLMKDGLMDIEQSKDMPGMLMSGGKLSILTRGGEKAGLGATGGSIFAKRLGTRAGEASYGTNIIVQESSAAITTNKRGGVIITGSCTQAPVVSKSLEYTLVYCVIESWPQPGIPLELKGPVYKYFPETNHYVQAGSEELVYAMKNEDLENWKKKKQGLCIISDCSKFEPNITKGMEDGVLVVKSLPPADFGKGMKGGVVIFDIFEEDDIEELKKRLTKDNHEGIILLRQQSEPDESRLLDLEWPEELLKQ